MNKIYKSISDYLTMRRQLGYKLTHDGQVLNRFAAFMMQKKKNNITTKLVIEFINHNDNSKKSNWKNKKIGMIRRFAIYQRTIDQRTEIPPLHLFQCHYTRRTPYIFSESEISQLLKAVSESVENRHLAETLYTLLGLIATTGMRISEAISLNNEFVDLSKGILEIRHTKFQKSRKIPLHPTTVEALKRYVKSRDIHYPIPLDSAFFINNHGGRLNRRTVQSIFRKICLSTGVGAKAALQPRIVDFRHSFSMRNLLRCYQEDLDVDQTIGFLSKYLGHENPEYTYWYLTTTPELLSLINLRIEKKYWRE